LSLADGIACANSWRETDLRTVTTRQIDGRHVGANGLEDWPSRLGGWLLLALLLVASRLDDMMFDAGWDETSYLLVAAEVLKGHLPYITAFDNKPPLLFLLLALGQMIFGKSLLASRLWVDGFVLATAILVFEYLRARHRPTLAWFGGALVILLNATWPGRLITSEALAMPFVLAAAGLVGSGTWRGAALAGFAMALATMVRSNLAIVTLAMGLLLVVWAAAERSRTAIGRIFAYGLGGLLPLATLIAAYAEAGALLQLRVSALDVALSYATEQQPVWRVIASLARQTAQLVLQEPLEMLPFSLILAEGAGWAILAIRPMLRWPPDANSRGDQVMVVTAIATGLSICLGGVAYPHYLLQFVPFAAIGVVHWLDSSTGTALRFERPNAIMIYSLAALLGLAVLIRHAPGGWRYALHRDEVEAHYPYRQVADAIAADRRHGDLVWAPSAHAVIWHLGVPPITPASTHPGNIVRPAIIAPLAASGMAAPDELGRILAKRPRYVVDMAPLPTSHLGDRTAEYRSWLQTHYRVWHQFGNLDVYRRAD
jgi:hypothetical protein